jgi:hypothetical protein
MDDSWPELLRALMEQCWARAADARPAMLSVQANLTTGFSSGGASAHGSSRTSARSGLESSGGGSSISGSTIAADDAANLSAAELEKKRMAEAVRRREAEETRRKMKEAELRRRKEREEEENQKYRHHGTYGRAIHSFLGVEIDKWSCCGCRHRPKGASAYCRGSPKNRNCEDCSGPFGY